VINDTKGKWLKIITIVVPITLLLLPLAGFGLMVSLSDIIQVLAGTHIWKTEIQFMDIWMLLTSSGGLIGLVGLWSYYLFQKRLLYTRTKLNWLIALSLLLGTAAALSLILLNGLQDFITTFSFGSLSFLCIAIFGLYLTGTLLKPHRLSLEETNMVQRD